MRLRSLLFVPADSDKKLQKSLDSAADALIFDLEDAVAPGRKTLARQMCAAHLAEWGGKRHWKALVRVNPRSSPDAVQDLAAVVGPGLDGVLLPKVDSVRDIELVSAQLDVLEARAGLTPGQVRILVVATETAQSMLNIAGYSQPPARLAGLTWGAEDLSSDIGAMGNREDDGGLSDVYRLARSYCLLAAGAARVDAIDTLYADFRDVAGLATDCRASRRRGFTGRIAIHPDQVDTINAGYTPSDEDLARARAVVAAFAAAPELGAVAIDGRMYDRPHLEQARRTLALARRE